MASVDGKPMSRWRATLSACLLHLSYALALPALFLAAGLAAFEAEVFETEVLAVTGARALEVASDFGLAAVFLEATFFAGLAAAASAPDFSASDFAGFAALAG